MSKSKFWEHWPDEVKQKVIDEWVQQKINEEKEKHNARKSN